MSLQPRKSDLRCTFTRFFRNVRSSLDLQNKIPIFVSDIQVIPTIERKYGGTAMYLFIYCLKCRIFIYSPL